MFIIPLKKTILLPKLSKIHLITIIPIRTTYMLLFDITCASPCVLCAPPLVKLEMIIIYFWLSCSRLHFYWYFLFPFEIPILVFKMESEESTEFFINLVANKPVLYDKRRSDFKNIVLKAKVWDEIGQQCNVSGE